MIFKYAVREGRFHIVMSLLCLIQAIFLFAVVIGLISIFMIRYSKYQPVRRLVERKGFVCDMVFSYHVDDQNEERSVASSEAYEKLLKNAEVFGQYEVWAFITDDPDVQVMEVSDMHWSNVRAYDDELIEGYKPKMQSGEWLRTESKEGESLEAVVLQTGDKYKVGDTVYLDNNSDTVLETKIPVKIIGIIERGADIFYQSNMSGFSDYRMIFSNMERETQTQDLGRISYTEGINNFYPEMFFISKRNLDCVQERYAAKEADKNLSENYEMVPPVEKKIFQTELSGVCIISMDEGSSQEDFEYNRNKIVRISQFDFLHDLEYVKKNTWYRLMANISDLIPVGAGMIVFTVISFITLSALMYQKNVRKYSIYYVNGLTWKNVFKIHILYILMLLLIALVFGTAVIYGVVKLGLINYVAFQVGIPQMAGCFAILVLLLISSSLMCISFVNGKSARDILQEVE